MHNIFQLNPKKKKIEIKSNLPKLSKFTKKKKKKKNVPPTMDLHVRRTTSSCMHESLNEAAGWHCNYDFRSRYRLRVQWQFNRAALSLEKPPGGERPPPPSLVTAGCTQYVNHLHFRMEDTNRRRTDRKLPASLPQDGFAIRPMPD